MNQDNKKLLDKLLLEFATAQHGLFVAQQSNSQYLQTIYEKREKIKQQIYNHIDSINNERRA